MKLVVQRVKHASVKVDNEIKGQIGQGFLVLLGIKKGDTKKDLEYCAKKLVGLRVFKDNEDKMNLSIQDIDGEFLIISQFTLYADTKKGNRPSFVMAEDPIIANNMYEEFLEEVRKISGKKVEKGVFGADMKIELLNDGPVTILIESPFSKEEG